MSVVEDLQRRTEALAGDAQRLVLAIFGRWRAGEITLNDAVALIAAVLNRANATAATLAEVYLVAQIEELGGVPVLSAGTLPVDDSERLVKAVTTVLTAPPKAKLEQDEIRDLIRSADLDPDMWNVEAITAEVNEAIRDMQPDPDDPDYLPDSSEYGFEDFVETISENPRKLSERGLFPPPPPRTPEYEQWKVDSIVPEINSDDYADRPPIWEAEPADAEMRLERLARAEPLETTHAVTVEIINRTPRVTGWTRVLDPDPCERCVRWAEDGRVFPKDAHFKRHLNCNCQQRIVMSGTETSSGTTERKAAS